MDNFLKDQLYFAYCKYFTTYNKKILEKNKIK